MNQTVKTIITVIVSVISTLIALSGLYYAVSEMQYLEYDVMRMTNPEIRKVEASYLGEAWKGEPAEEGDFYLLTISLYNPANFGMESNSVYLWYKADDYIREVKTEESSLFSYDNVEYIPPDKVATIYRIVHVPEGCEGFYVVQRNSNADTTQSFQVKL